MSVFDAEIFAQAVLGDVRKVLDRLDEFGEEKKKPALAEFLAFQNDVEATLAALEVERDGRRARALRDDLAHFLPKRKEDLLAVACHTEHLRLGTFYCDLEKAIDDAIRASEIVAKAFTTGGGL